jgi:ADP-heptose:LPS heptosyltransferase
VADRLAREWNARIVLTGGADEQETVRAVLTCMNMPALNLAGRTSLGGLAALINKFTLFISNDTGPAHMACAVDSASITLFGPAEYQRWAPLDHSLHRAVRRSVACSPCGYWECPIDHRCLRWLTPNMVLSAAERLIHEAT